MPCQIVKTHFSPPHSYNFFSQQPKVKPIRLPTQNYISFPNSKTHFQHLTKLKTLLLALSRPAKRSPSLSLSVRIHLYLRIQLSKSEEGEEAMVQGGAILRERISLGRCKQEKPRRRQKGSAREGGYALSRLEGRKIAVENVATAGEML